VIKLAVGHGLKESLHRLRTEINKALMLLAKFFQRSYELLVLLLQLLNSSIVARFLLLEILNGS